MLPTDWQQQGLDFVRKSLRENPHKTIWGLVLPANWKGSLWSAFKGNQLHRLFNVRAIAFDGEVMRTFDKGEQVPAPTVKKTKG